MQTKEQIAQRKKAYYEENIKKFKEYNKKNREDIVRKRRENYKKNRRSIIEKSKKYNKEHKEERKEYEEEYQKIYREEHKEDNKKYQKKYREDNKEKNKKRYKNNISLRLNASMSVSVRQSLKTNNISKNRRKWRNLVGYTPQELKTHLESLFLPGMKWNNYGRKKGIKCWEIDHILPVSFFGYKSTNDVEFRYCWSLNNLQPLWAKDNLAKSDKLIFSCQDH